MKDYEPLRLQNAPPIINKMPQRFNVLCTPLFNQSSSTIDLIFAQTEPLMRRAECLFQSEATLDQHCRLKPEAE
jgi:hypothetical protein